MEINPTVKAYLECALFTSEHNDDPREENYTIEDFSPLAVIKATRDCAVMTAAALALYTATDLESSAIELQDAEAIESFMSGDNIEENIGHDLWLTRTGAGVGFWDRGLGEFGDELTTISKAMGSVDVTVGDDGKLWLEG